MDLYKRLYRPDASGEHYVRVGRVATGALVIVACLLAPLPASFEGVFNYIQMIWGFVSPGVVAVFCFAFLVPRAPDAAALVGLAVGGPVYGGLLWALPDVAFLNHMAATFLVVVGAMSVMTLTSPREQPFRFERKSDIDLTPDPWARPMGIGVLLAVVALYVVFR